MDATRILESYDPAGKMQLRTILRQLMALEFLPKIQRQLRSECLDALVANFDTDTLARITTETANGLRFTLTIESLIQDILNNPSGIES